MEGCLRSQGFEALCATISRSGLNEAAGAAIQQLRSDRPNYDSSSAAWSALNGRLPNVGIAGAARRPPARGKPAKTPRGNGHCGVHSVSLSSLLRFPFNS